MANIPINYVINNKPLLDLNKTLEDINRAQDKLNNSVRQTGQVYSSTLAGMRSRLDSLRAALENTAQADQARISRLSAEYKKLDAEINRITADIYKQTAAVEQMNTSVQKAATSFTSLVGQVRAFVTAGLLRETLDAALGMAELAGNVEGVTRAFQRLPQSTVLLERLRASTHGAMTDLQLMQQAIRAQNFKIPLEQMGMYLEFAMQRAQATGESIDYMVNSIITGLGRDSIKILDNLQVDIATMKKEMDELGISMDEAFGRQVQAEMAKMGGYIETQKDQVAQLRTAWEELRVSFAQMASSSGFIAWLTEAVNGLKLIIQSGGDYQKMMQIMSKDFALEEAVKKLNAVEKQLNGTREEKLRQIAEEITKNSEYINLNLQRLDQAKAQRAELMDFNVANQDEIDLVNEQIKTYMQRLNIGREFSDMLVDLMLKLKNVTKAEVEELGIIQRINKTIESLTDLREKSQSLEMITQYNDQLALQRAILQDIMNLTNQIDQNASRAYDVRQKPGGATPTAPVRTNMSDLLAADSINLGKSLGKKFGLQLGESMKEGFNESTFWDGIKESFQAHWDELITQGIDTLQQSIYDIMDIELMSYEYRIDALKSYYDRQQLLAGDNTRKKKELQLKEDKEVNELRRQQAVREQRARMFGIVIDTAASIAKTAATMGFPAAIPFIALAALTGAIQLGIASKAKPQGFKDGVIDLQKPGAAPDRDSVPAMLQPGESVITKAGTKRGKRLLAGIEASLFDDSIIERLQLTPNGVRMVEQDLKPIVTAIENSRVDIYAQASTVMEVRYDQEARRKVHRSRSI